MQVDFNSPKFFRQTAVLISQTFLSPKFSILYAKLASYIIFMQSQTECMEVGHIVADCSDGL